MQLAVILEQRFEGTPDGRVWTSAAYPYNFWLRYLEVFDQLTIVARVRHAPAVPESYKLVDGPGVAVRAISYYHGPRQFFSVAPRVAQELKTGLPSDSAILMRIPSLIANLGESVLAHRRQPFGVEVVGDPFDVFSSGILPQPAGWLLRSWFSRAQRRQCQNAVCAAYVTERTLQQRYPCAGLEVAVSDVEITDSDLVNAPRAYGLAATGFTQSPSFAGAEAATAASLPARKRLVFVGSLEQRYKAPDILIAALARLVARGCDIELVMIGDGAFRSELELLARDSGVADRVLFRGMVPREAVRSELDAADLFVLPSRTEGLPRAMIEAMARALPCIGSYAGGIPELLHPEDLVPIGDADALAAKIEQVLSQPERLMEMSARNLKRARAFKTEILQQRRRDFLAYLAQVTSRWLEVSRK